jgi:microcystin-dependent protein
MAGSTTYPTSVDNKTPLQDGVDVIEADDVNDSYVPLNAIEIFVGPAGKPQSGSIDILEYLRFFGDPANEVRLEWVSVSQVKIKAGVIWCTNAAATIRVPRKLTADITITLPTDLDTGGEAASTRYYIIAVADAANTTITGKFSLSKTAPTGITTFAVLGSCVNNASSDIDRWSVKNFRDRTKVGSIMEWAGTIATLPEGWKHCDGSAISRTLFDDLFTAIGTQYGAGDGSTTYNIPEARDRFVVGAKQDNSGAAMTNLTGALTKSGGDTNQPPKTSNDLNGAFQPAGSNPPLSCSNSPHQHNFTPPFVSFVVAVKI